MLSMMKFAVVFFAIAVSVQEIKGQDLLFNCNLMTTPCSGSGTCGADGTCTCDATAAGAACDKVLATMDLNDCTTTPCENGGTCYDNTAADGTVDCDCPATYAGPTCNVLRVDATCTDDGGDPATQLSVEFNIYPHSYFDDTTGKIFAKGSVGVPACNAVTDGTDPALKTLDVDHAAGTCVAATETVAGSGIYTRCVYLVHTANAVLPGYDYEICATCPNGGDTVTASATITINDVDDNINKIDLGGAAPGDASMVLSSGGMDLADGAAVIFGAGVTATFTLEQVGLDKGFTTLSITSCTAQNGETPITPRTLEVLVDGCPGTIVGPYLGFTSSETSATVRAMTFNAFVWQDAPQEIFLTCEIKLCKVASDCAMTDCSGDMHIGRKKRQADDGETDQKSVSQTLRVIDPNDPIYLNQAVGGSAEEKACFMTWQMTASIIALSVALLLVLIICVILVVKTILRRRVTKTVYRDESPAGSTTTFPGLPTLVSSK